MASRILRFFPKFRFGVPKNRESEVPTVKLSPTEYIRINAGKQTFLLRGLSDGFGFQLQITHYNKRKDRKLIVGYAHQVIIPKFDTFCVSYATEERAKNIASILSCIHKE